MPLKYPEKHTGRLRTLGGYIPVADAELIDEDHCVYRGNRIMEPNTPEDEAGDVFFQCWEPDEPGLLGSAYKVFKIDDISVLGFPFWLVPKDRVLFYYDKYSSVIVPAPMQTKPRKRIPGLN